MNESPRTPVFQCRQCGDCCQGNGGILLSQKEMRKMAGFLKISLKDFRQQYVTASSLGPNLVTHNNVCVFQMENRCRVHPVKPRICREWPYLPALLKYAEEFEEAKGACPGIDPECSHADFVAAARAGEDRYSILRGGPQERDYPLSSSSPPSPLNGSCGGQNPGKQR